MSAGIVPQNFHSVRHLSISASQEGQRIDNFLFNQLHGVPKSRVYRILRSGEVRVNKGRVKPSYRLCEGDELRLPPIRLEEKKIAVVNPQTIEWLESLILHEDDDLLVLNKPAGFPVHSGSGHDKGVVDVLQHRMRAVEPTEPNASWPQLVHRLDLDTSGVLMLAKNRSTLLHWQGQWEQLSKRYQVLVAGKWRGGAVRLPLKRRNSEQGPAVVVDPSGQKASTHFQWRESFAGAATQPPCSLLTAQLETGRMHQIRVHAAESGHPVLGDERYGDFSLNRQFKTLGLRRLFLHAEKISIGDIKFEAPLAPELDKFLLTLRTQA